MKLVIGSEVIATPRDTYSFKLVVDFMHGDADADTSTELWIKEYDTDEVRNLITIVEALEKFMKAKEANHNKYCNGKYEVVKELVGEKALQLACNYDVWPSDVFTYGERLASPENITVTYFDGKSREHTVEVVE